ncbi:hypothetical protein JOF53_005418 [Crossiella equi]|uniref:Trypsin-like peptidase domain-containing protein n=1 Tax=Crossiella equi TaxID=130796 RepID=A0ABS5AJ00_9PSEU|nr:serine protease [Crossiella equi]MBP2476546.1 hypothetical protein [Crossiella equi]
MGAGTGDSAAGDRAEQPWRLRLRTGAHVLGGGSLLGGRYVLTCAHVLPGRDAEVEVDFCGTRQARGTTAAVVADCHFPEDEDGTGDLALLELAEPRPDGWGVRLRAGRCAPGRLVTAYGFPEGAPHGMWARAELSRHAGPHAAWRQLDALRGNRIRSGFSGAGVLDEEVGALLGVVVTAFPEQDSAWMLPVAEILRYLPVVGEYTDTGPLPHDGVRDFLRRSLPGQVAFIVLGASDSATSRVLAEAVEGAEQPVVVVDVTGRTPGEVSRHLAAEGLRVGSPIEAPVALVAVGIDESSQPERLVSEVLDPLADQGAAVLFGFRHDSSASLAVLRSQRAEVRPVRTDSLVLRLADLATLEEEVRVLWGQDEPRFAGVPEPRDRAGGLRPLLSAVRRLSPAARAEHLADCARRVERALHKAEAERDRLRGHRDRLRELRGLAQAYQRLAAEHGLAEDEELDTAYRAALGLLQVRPCVLAEAEAAVHGYRDAVVRRCR